MTLMKQKTRLSLILLIIIGSAVYALLMAYDDELARTIVLGYIGVILTAFFFVEVWKKHG